MREIRSYLVRVYRHDADSLAGVVEDVRSSRIVPFQSLAELCLVLSGRKRFARRGVRPRRAAP
ncbi:hypothetical protein GCM10023165_56250 [Variovorax defluvii]|uniref:Uncharacterized protein n=1 Tax=Variovorax defluvii TaxID=913761 RepID=A0ABP8IJ75_9BURK